MRLASPRLYLLVLIVSGIALFTAAQTAVAAEYTEFTCTGYEFTDAYLWDTDWNDNWWSSGGCDPDAGPPSYSIGTGAADSHLGDVSEDFTIDSTYAEIKHASAIVTPVSDDLTGIEVSIQACRMSICSLPSTSTADEQGGLSLESEANNIPANASTFVVRAKCVIAVCPAGSSVRISNVEITRIDDTPPAFTFFEIDENDEPLPEAAKWNNGLIRWNTEPFLMWADMQSLLTYFEVEMENVDLCYSVYIPNAWIPDCTNIPDQSSPDMFASQFEDGHHDLTLGLTNRAGLTTTQTITVKTDVTPPDPPDQIETSPHFLTWQNSRDVRIDWTNWRETLESSTESGIAGFTYDVAPRFGGGNPPTSSENPGPVTVNKPGANSLQLRLPSAGQWTVQIETFDRAGNVSDAATASINIDDARPPAPTLDDIPAINANDLSSGRTIAWTPGETSVSGICGYDWAIAPVAGYNPGEDPATPMLANDVTQLDLSESQVEGLSERPQRFHLRAYSCAGVPGEIAHVPVLVDFTPPRVSISPDGGTLASGEPISVSVQDVKAGTIQSGIASVECTVKGTSVPCANGSQLPLGGGDNHVVVTATDLAGNSATAEADLLVDASAPSGWIEQPNPADPTLVRATVQDADTGVESAELEFQSAAGGPWMKLGNGFDTDHPTPGTVGLSARIPDAGEISDGDYLLRVRVSDGIGSSAVISRRSSGETAGFSIPLRARAVLSATLVKSANSKTDPLSRLTVNYGAMPTIVGVLKRADGTPIAGAALTILADQAGAPIHTFASVVTRADGTYSQPVPVGGSRRLVVRFAGDLATRSTAAEAKLQVRGKITLKASSRSVRSKGVLHLRGKVFSEGATLPLIGKAVELRFRIAGRNSSWTRTKRTLSDGRFDFRFSYAVRGRPVRFAVRAVAVVEPTWAFAEGTSKQTKFVVKP